MDLEIDENWEFEYIRLDVSSKGLGISIKGGLDSPDIHNNPSVYVSKVFIDGMAFKDGRLQLGDIILSVNGVPMTDVMHFEAVDIILNAGPEIIFYVQRKKCFIYEQIPEPIEVEGVFKVELNKGDKGFGICISGGSDNQHIKGDNSIYVTRIVDNGVAQMDGRIEVGDRLLAINDVRLEDFTYEEAVSAMRLSPKKSLLTIAKK